MSTPILATKLYVPQPRLKIVLRPRLVNRLNEGLAAGRKLTLISAPAGFGKTTLVSDADCLIRYNDPAVAGHHAISMMVWTAQESKIRLHDGLFVPPVGIEPTFEP
jgi:hypothetical protein